MGYAPRLFQPDEIYFITSRTIEGALFLRPSPAIKQRDWLCPRRCAGTLPRRALRVRFPQQPYAPRGAQRRLEQIHSIAPARRQTSIQGKELKDE